MISKLSIFVFLIIIFFCCQNIFAQTKIDDEIQNDGKAELIHTSSYQNAEISSLNIDVLQNAVKKNKNSKGVFIFYCGKVCSYGEIEAHIRGLSIALAGKGWKSSEYSIIQGGYRDSFELEYWVIPENACLPIPKSNVDFKDIKFKGIFKSKVIDYDFYG